MFLANVASGHLTPIDAPLLGRVCTCLAYADEANEKIMGRVVVVVDGLVAHGNIQAPIGGLGGEGGKFETVNWAWTEHARPCLIPRA